MIEIYIPEEHNLTLFYWRIQSYNYFPEENDPMIVVFTEEYDPNYKLNKYLPS